MTRKESEACGIWDAWCVWRRRVVGDRVLSWVLCDVFCFRCGVVVAEERAECSVLFFGDSSFGEWAEVCPVAKSCVVVAREIV